MVLNKATVKRLRKEARDAGPDKDPVSEWYEERISKGAGRRTGQVHTPPSVANLMARMMLSEGISAILDPACGCGAFLRALSFTKGVEGAKVLGLEPLPVPVRLARINIQDMPNIKVQQMDFFDMGPTGDWDGVIGNPPYVRQELLGKKVKGTQMSRRADLYAYFIEHATRMLRDGGMLVFIVPDKWMDVGYGEGLKRFLLDNHRIGTILAFDANVFERAEVDTVIVAFRRCDDKVARDDNVVTFARLQRPTSIEGILEMKDEGLEVAKAVQRDLRPKSRWSHLLRAPRVFKEILASGKVVPLSSIKGLTISRGVTTNQTRFFFPSEEDIERLGIPKAFLAPAIKSPKEVDGLRLLRAPRYLLLVAKEVTPGDRKGLVRVLRWGNERIWGSGRKVRVRDLPSFGQKGDDWYLLTVEGVGNIILPKFVRGGRPRFIWNEAGAHASDTFQTIRVRRTKDVELVLGCLNSVLGALSCELVGRVEGRGLLQVMTYELGDVVIPDPGKMGPSERKRMISGFRTLVRDRDPKELDEAVSFVLGKRGWRKRYEALVKAYKDVVDVRQGKQRTILPVRVP